VVIRFIAKKRRCSLLVMQKKRGKVKLHLIRANLTLGLISKYGMNVLLHHSKEKLLLVLARPCCRRRSIQSTRSRSEATSCRRRSRRWWRTRKKDSPEVLHRSHDRHGKCRPDHVCPSVGANQSNSTANRSNQRSNCRDFWARSSPVTMTMMTKATL